MCIKNASDAVDHRCRDIKRQYGLESGKPIRTAQDLNKVGIVNMPAVIQ